MDAVRISDGKVVFLKYIPRSSHETEINRYLVSNGLKDDPKNHALPLLEVLEDDSDPENAILVFPMVRRIDHPGLESVREAVDYVEQSLEVSITK